MKSFSEIDRYCCKHYPFVLDLFRVVVGVIIFYQGVMFVQNGEALDEIINRSRVGGWAFILEHHVAFTLLVGGILIAIGLITRWAVAFQFPVFLGMIINQHATHGLYSVYSNLGLAYGITIALVLLFVLGPGPFSVDHRMKKASEQMAHN